MKTLGFSLEKNCSRVALLRREKEQIVIDRLEIFNHDNHLHFFLENQDVKICTGLDCDEVLIRELTFKLKKRSHILAALPFQAETLLPYSLEEAILIPFFYPSGRVTFFASQKIQLENHLKKISAVGVTPHTVSCSSRALIRFAKWIVPEQPYLLLLHIGAQKSQCLLLSGDAIPFSQTLNFGSDDFATSEPQLQKDLFRISAFINRKIALSEPHSLLLTGNIPSEIVKEIHKELSVAFPLIKLKHEETFLKVQHFAIPIGLALEQFESEEPPLQFLQGAYQQPAEKKRVKRKLLQFAVASLLFSATLWATTFLMIIKKENEMFSLLKSHISEQVSSNDLSEALGQWEETLKEQKPSFPFVLTVPTVTDVLAWLSSHPCLATDETRGDKIDIKKIRYTLNKYPKLGTGKGPYEAKVELELTASSPRLAREFHNALLSGDDFINPKANISWNATQNSYQTSFVLKNISEVK